jgi:hypothetical protein
MYDYGTLKPVKVILRRGREKRGTSGGDEANRDTLHEYMAKNPCATPTY